MTDSNSAWADTLTHLLALATKLEGHGQYNNAKLMRAAAESLARRAAYRLDLLRQGKVQPEKQNKQGDKGNQDRL